MEIPAYLLKSLRNIVKLDCRETGFDPEDHTVTKAIDTIEALVEENKMLLQIEANLTNLHNIALVECEKLKERLNRIGNIQEDSDDGSKI